MLAESGCGRSHSDAGAAEQAVALEPARRRCSLLPPTPARAGPVNRSVRRTCDGAPDVSVNRLGPWREASLVAGCVRAFACVW